MRIGIIGLGGVGGFYGGKLARRYGPGGEHDILFFCRGAHRDAVRTGGLRVISREGQFVAHPLAATDDPDELGSLDVVLFCVKGYDLAGVAERVRPAIRPDSMLVPLGNGVNNDQVISQALDTGDCLGGCVYISSHIEGPGVVEQTGGSCKLLFGSRTGAMEPYRGLEALSRQADIDATLTPTILEDVWMKFAFIDPVSGVTSLFACSIGEVLHDPRKRAVLDGMMAEVALLAQAEDVGLPDDVVEQSLGKVRAFPADAKSSMQLDVEAGRRSELDTMLGYVVEEGRRLEVPTPFHETVYDGLKRRLS